MPISGIEISNQINLSTRGKWRASPGSIYFILNELLSLKMISEVIGFGSNVKRYITTNKGRRILSSFLTSADKVLIKQFLFIGIIAQIAENDMAKILVELAELTIDKNKRKDDNIRKTLQQLFLTIEKL